MMDNEGFNDWLEGRRPGPPCSRLLRFRCVEFDTRAGTTTVEFDPPPETANPVGGVSGGNLAEMLNRTMASAVKIGLEPTEFPTTVEFKVTFLRPARFGKSVARARVIQKGNALAFAEGELRSPEGKLVATATGTFRIVTVRDVSLDWGSAT